MFILMTENIFLIICSNMLLIWAKHNIHIYAPQLKGGDIFGFAADPVNASVASFQYVIF